jgi:NAD(P)-dependent dehydrogenase (short-subunit alcohol dehydrogenase family)
MENLSFDHLKGKVCVITGGAGIIGTSISKALASVGIKTAIADLNKILAEKLASEIKKEFQSDSIGVEMNVLDKGSIIAAKNEINEKLGKIDFLINGAGGNHPKATTQVEQMDKKNVTEKDKTFYGLDIEGFDKVFDLNFKGTLIPTMVLTQDMLEKGEGVVLNISSMNSFKPLTKIPAYSAAKASINNFTQWLAVHLAKTGIRVNAVAPGFFLTNQNRFLMVDEKTGNATPRGQKIISNTPMGRYGEIDDLQGTCLFLLSQLSKFITGIILPVDGGYSAFGGV